MDNKPKGETIGEIFNTLNEKQKTVVYALIEQALQDKETGEDGGETISREIFNTLNKKQKTAVYALVGQALQDKERTIFNGQ